MSNQENMTASPINEDTILVAELQADSPVDAIRQMAEILSRQGIVKPEFVEAVLAREKEYPTGIPVGVPVALPHTDAEQCLKPAVLIGKMERPVAFGMMGGEEDDTVDVLLVFIVSLPDPKNQVETLKKLTEIFREQVILENILTTTSTDEIKHMIAEKFS